MKEIAIKLAAEIEELLEAETERLDGANGCWSWPAYKITDLIHQQLEVVAKAARREALLRAGEFAAAWDYTCEDRRALATPPGSKYLTVDIRRGRDDACEGIADALRRMAEEAT